MQPPKSLPSCTLHAPAASISPNSPATRSTFSHSTAPPQPSTRLQASWQCCPLGRAAGGLRLGALTRAARVRHTPPPAARSAWRPDCTSGHRSTRRNRNCSAISQPCGCVSRNQKFSGSSILAAIASKPGQLPERHPKPSNADGPAATHHDELAVPWGPKAARATTCAASTKSQHTTQTIS
jgi:hypothetical protein